MKRTERFGKIFAIAHILGENNKEPGTPSISEKYMIRYQRDPGGTLPDIRRELMKEAGEKMYQKVLRNIDATTKKKSVG